MKAKLLTSMNGGFFNRDMKGEIFDVIKYERDGEFFYEFVPFHSQPISLPTSNFEECPEQYVDTRDVLFVEDGSISDTDMEILKVKYIVIVYRKGSKLPQIIK